MPRTEGEGVTGDLLPADRRMLGAVLVAALAVRLPGVTNLNVNWDEFFYLSLVHEYLRGQLALPLQTAYVHFFTWLPSATLNEVDQVIAARLVMLGLHFLTVLLLYRMARRVAGRQAALFAALAYLSVSLVIRNGTSFRSDTIATPLIMAGCDLLLLRPASTRRAVVAGILVACAVMVTIKMAMFVPTLALLLSNSLRARGEKMRAVLRQVAAMAIAGTLAFVLLHRLHLALIGPVGTRSSAELAATSLSTTVAKASFLPQRDTLVATLVWDMAFWALWLFACAELARKVRVAEGSERARWIAIGALALPVAAIAVYRNSFPYFYPTILAPASVLLAVAWQRILTVGRAPIVIALSWFAASLLVHGVYVPLTTPLAHQRLTVAAVHRAFPQPVPYLDRSSALASFPQAGFFMTTWALDAYLDRSRPVLREAILRNGPPLLLANHPLLNPDQLIVPASPDDSLYLLPEDREALVETYIQHWGPIYVAGKRLQASGDTGQVEFELLVPGRYTLEASRPITLDGRSLIPGHSVHLTRGRHRAVLSPAEQATLRWGERLYRPAQAPPEREFFLGF